MSEAMKAIIFDAYGTLFDVQGSMKIKFNALIPHQGDQVRALWRTKYHEYNMLRSFLTSSLILSSTT